MKNTDTTDQAVETPEVDEKGPLSGFEEFSIEEDADPEIPKEVDAPEALEKSEETEEEKEEVEEVKEEEEEKIEEKVEEKAEPEFTFKAPEIKEETTEETNETWKNIGEDLGLSVEGENFEDFTKAFQSKLEKVQKEAYNKAKEEIPNIPENLDPQTRNLLELSQKGIDLKEYLDPINTIDGYLKYDNKTLVTEDYKNMMNGEQRLYTDEEINAKIDRLENSDSLLDKADEIREQLIVEKQNISQEIIEQQQENQEQQYHQQQENTRAQSENFINTVNSTDEFMGGKINDDIKQHVNQMWQKGEIHELFNDPKKIVDYVLYHTVGDQVLQQRDNDSFSNGQSKAKKSLHNIPPVISGGANRGVEESKPEEAGDFSVWESAIAQVRAD